MGTLSADYHYLRGRGFWPLRAALIVLRRAWWQRDGRRARLARRRDFQRS
jgi:hypothetical protein